MSVYDLIADNYSAIFPPDENRIRFIKSICPSVSSRILDVGCATGDIAIELARSGYDVVGIDLNEKMINIARNNILGENLKIEFRVMDMLEIGEIGLFDLVLCFGNTLPHLKSEAKIIEFFSAAYDCLKYQGAFVFQILNYDKILSEGKIDFRIVETGSFVFKRNYDFLPEGSIEFRIEFQDKNTGNVYSDTTRLLPVRRGRALALLEKIGFGKVDVYSDYKMTESDLREYASIYVAAKTG